MKIRKGFVSNSSSSSFVVIMERSAFDVVMDSLHPYIREVVKELGVERLKFLGRDVVKISVYTSDEGLSELDNEINFPPEKMPDGDRDDYSRDDDDPRFGKMTPDEAWKEFQEALPDNDQVITDDAQC